MTLSGLALLQRFLELQSLSPTDPEPLLEPTTYHDSQIKIKLIKTHELEIVRFRFYLI